jgi:diacylglycerol kinase family enzyme
LDREDSSSKEPAARSLELALVRLLLVANVNAQTVTPRKVSVIERALSSEFKVELVHTERGGHGIDVARRGIQEGFDLIVAMGGDGTVNEVANGLAGSRVPMGIIPGGGTNVLARSLGIPTDPIEATGHLLAHRDRQPRRVPLGRAGERYFTFSCGVGLDGAIVRRVERRQLLKKTVGESYYIWTALSTLLFRYDRRSPRIRLRWGPDLAMTHEAVFLAICQKTSPYTYLGNRPMRICPQADLDLGLDLLAIDSMRTLFVFRTAARTLGAARHTGSRHVVYLHDQPRIGIECDGPMPVQADGEYVGERDALILEAVPDSLSLLY